MRCLRCNAADHEPTAKFCHVCGAKLSGSISILRDIEAIDLGLPSGTRWANMNIGAKKPEECGSYFAWGETEEKIEYSWESYVFCDNDFGLGCVHLGSDISGTQYDAAYVKLGRQWRMPSFDQFMELIRNCEFEFTTLHGVLGGKFTSKINGNSIFFPTTGEYLDRQIKYRDKAGYWAGTQDPADREYYAHSFDFVNGFVCTDFHERNIGLPVRPVTMGNIKEIQTCVERSSGKNLLLRWMRK